MESIAGKILSKLLYSDLFIRLDLANPNGVGPGQETVNGVIIGRFDDDEAMILGIITFSTHGYGAFRGLEVNVSSDQNQWQEMVERQTAQWDPAWRTESYHVFRHARSERARQVQALRWSSRPASDLLVMLHLNRLLGVIGLVKTQGATLDERTLLGHIEKRLQQFITLDALQPYQRLFASL